MNHHACLNKFFRLVWSAARGGWMAVAETARGRGKSGTRRGRGMTAAALVGAGLSSLHGLALAGAAPPAPTQLPTGGQVVAGQATLHQGGATLAVQQASQRAVIDWKTFDLGSQARVDFLQPNASAVTLNRVLDANASQIFGRISAPGQVFITNPNGVLFGATAQVDVGGLVATTLALGNDDFMAGSTTFGAGATSVRGAAVVNQGTLGARLGGYIALLAPEVRNEGVIVAREGTVALAAGEQVTLQFDGRRPVAVRVDRAALDALVDNRHAIRADGGLVVLVASSANALLDTVISNSGTLRADTLAQRGGRIVLEGGALGVVAVSGTLQARGNAAGEVGGAVLASGDK
ncbi:MAG: filamentous hemagglutinin N-terminal domain-containing protein, partial [Betaproteobacteria bacterium]